MTSKVISVIFVIYGVCTSLKRRVICTVRALPYTTKWFCWNASIISGNATSPLYIGRFLMRRKALWWGSKIVKVEIPCNHVLGDVRPFSHKGNLLCLTYFGSHVGFVNDEQKCKRTLRHSNLSSNAISTTVHNCIVNEDGDVKLLNFTISPNLLINNLNFDKNFMPFTFENRLLMVCNISPHMIFHVDDTNTMHFVCSSHFPLPKFHSGCNHVGGSASPVLIQYEGNDVFLTLGHTRCGGAGGKRKTFAYIFRAEWPFDPLGCTNEIDLNIDNTEFATNIIVNDDVATLSVGVGDTHTVFIDIAVEVLLQKIIPVNSIEGESSEKKCSIAWTHTSTQ